MIFSLAHATLLHLSPPELVRTAAATGYQAVGLRLIPIDRPGEPRWALDEHPGLLEETRRALAETNIRFVDVEVVQLRDRQDFHELLPSLEAAAELGARYVLTNLYTTGRDAADEAFTAFCDFVRPLGLTAALELVSFSSLPTLSETVAMVRRSGRENACVLIDTLHFHSSRTSVEELAQVPPSLMPYVHVCDGPPEIPADLEGLRRIAREGRLLPGEGGIDLGGILRHVPKSAVYAIEAPNPDRARALGAEAYARLALEATARYVRDPL